MGKKIILSEKQALQIALYSKKYDGLRLVHNVEPSEPSEENSMIQCWEEKTGRQLDKEEYTCPHCHQKVKREDLHGAHVSCIDEPERQYIVPLCASFNESHDTESHFFVPEADLVVAP